MYGGLSFWLPRVGWTNGRDVEEGIVDMEWVAYSPCVH